MEKSIRFSIEVGESKPNASTGQVVDFICQAEGLDFVVRTAWEALKSFKESQVVAALLCSMKDTMEQREDRCREKVFYGWSFPCCS